MSQWLREWWITIRYASVFTKSGRMYRRTMRSINLDDPGEWVELKRPE